jgi:glycosyltransferase involved in cell wall biosynthesis
MRVLYDISTLGFAHLYQQSRGGAFRVDLHVTEGLEASAECELFFCANHSSVAYHGCQEFLRRHERLRRVPLVAPLNSGGAAVRAAASSAHRRIRQLFGSNVLPSVVRHLAGFVDRRLHPPVNGAASAIDILHSPSAPLPAASNRRSPRRFLTVYDLRFRRLPKSYDAVYRRDFGRVLDSLREGDHVITPSGFVRDEILAHRVASPDRIHVVPLAADQTLFYECEDSQRIASIRHKYRIPEGPYVLGVNTPDIRKNVSHAIHAFGRVSRDAGGALQSLVLTGHSGPGSDDIRRAVAQYPELRGRILLTGHVPDEDLAPLYSGALVFVYPSLYEGFGLPPLEAMQCGTPVITSNTSSLPEVVGDGGLLVAPDDLDGLTGAILAVACDSDVRLRLQQRALAQAARFSWERTTAATLRAYRAALHG